MKIDMKSRTKFVDAAKKLFGDKKTSLTRSEVQLIVEKKGLSFPNWLTVDKRFRAGRGVYFLSVLPPSNSKAPKTQKAAKAKKVEREVKPALIVPRVPIVAAPKVEASPEMNMAAPVAHHEVHLNLVPDEEKGYVPFGHFDDLLKIIESKLFYPAYITGLSGNGKTMMAEQVHAKLGRECIRVNVTIETDEDDLIGGFRLVNGATVWQNGPVIVAMQRGATLILDEVDLGSNKLMCLQPVLEGKGIYIKKINTFISPAPGFNVIATANTKGKGSEDGRFIGTNIMNEAFLERFSITLEQEYPSEKVENKILNNVLKNAGLKDEDFTEILVKWARILREAFMEGATTEVISTRRLVHICQAYAIFDRNRIKAIDMCLARFDTETKESMKATYMKLDATINPLDNNSATLADPTIPDSTIPF